MDAPTFTTSPAGPEPPAVDAFLTAVDRAMNSNTLLLSAECDVPVTAENEQDVLHAFLRSTAFEHLLCAADARRNWHNLAEPSDLPLLREGHLAILTPLTHAGLRTRLRWMLTEAPSPYGRHSSPADADRSVSAFTRALLGPNGPRWSCAAVTPDFLRSTGYRTDEVPRHPAYFDGGPSDTATLIHRGHTLHLLLTNGSP
ncbi:hypothetical protein ACIRD3_38110 [Kitasatospora sp. NPDC093550]|uniref:hypothetical protein n=1 Tax=Kitasatospora sp. NPDC093550 TaxID=3364089 RepID=UPI00382B1BA0